MKYLSLSIAHFLIIILIHLLITPNVSAQDIFINEACACDDGSGISEFVLTLDNWPTDPGDSYEIVIRYSAMGGGTSTATQTNIPGNPSGTIQLTFSAIADAASIGELQISRVTHLATNTNESVVFSDVRYESPDPVSIDLPADTTVSSCLLGGDQIPDVFDHWISDVSAAGGCGNIDITNDWDGTYPDSCGGSVSVEFTGTDTTCGSTAVSTAVFTVVDCRKPNPIAVNGLVAVDVAASGCADVNISQFDAGSFDDCGEVTLSYSSDPSDTVRTFCCNGEVAPREVEFWVTDESGNQDFVISFIDIRNCDSHGLEISGTIATMDGSGVEGVEVFLDDTSSTAPLKQTTGGSGFYTFFDLDVDEPTAYRVRPMKNDDVLNGVSTLDILLIQSHILNIVRMDDPYQLIAADVNDDERISGTDLIELRRTILGINSEFRYNTSWRFVDATEALQEGELPLDYPETIELILDHQSQLNQDFVAVKIGDVNGSAIPNNFTDTMIEGHSGELVLTTENAVVEARDMVEVDITSSGLSELRGCQFTLEYAADQLSLLEVQRGALSLGNHNFANFSDRGMMTMSWNKVSGANTHKNEVLFTLIFRAKQATRLSNVLEISDAITRAEAYIGGETRDISLRFTQNTKGFSLHQNSPNPFNKQTIIGFNLPEEGRATLTFYDGLGNIVHFIEGDYTAGLNQVRIDKEDFPVKGLYYYELRSGGRKALKKMVIAEK